MTGNEVSSCVQDASIDQLNRRDATPDLAGLKETLAALRKCDEVKFKSDGFNYSVRLSGTRDDSFGDAGAILTMIVTMTGGGLPKAIDFETTMYSAQVGELAVQVSAPSGLTDTQAKVPADIGLLREVMDLTVTRTEDAQ